MKCKIDDFLETMDFVLLFNLRCAVHKVVIPELVRRIFNELDESD